MAKTRRTRKALRHGGSVLFSTQARFAQFELRFRNIPRVTATMDVPSRTITQVSVYHHGFSKGSRIDTLPIERLQGILDQAVLDFEEILSND